MEQPIQLVNLNTIDLTQFEQCCVGCMVLTQDNQIMLQQRCHNWHSFPDYLAEFGGHIEANESPIQALQRELNEELGAQVNPSEVISFGALTETVSKHSILVYEYFWHDKHGTITGCYECEARYYDNCAAVLKHPKIMDDVRWSLNKCQKLKLLR